jgi:hypothetical protein
MLAAMSRLLTLDLLGRWLSRWLSRWLRCAAGGVLLTSCGGLSPGDYVVYRLSIESMSVTAGCFVDGEIPLNDKDDSSDIGVPATIVLYAGADDTYYLDMGSVTYSGTETKKGYSFSGDSVDVNVESGGMMMGTKREEFITATRIEFGVDGASVTGTMTEKIDYRCTGDACPDVRQRTCNKQANFIGSEVEDVELEHTI